MTRVDMVFPCLRSGRAARPSAYNLPTHSDLNTTYLEQTCEVWSCTDNNGFSLRTETRQHPGDLLIRSHLGTLAIGHQPALPVLPSQATFCAGSVLDADRVQLRRLLRTVHLPCERTYIVPHARRPLGEERGAAPRPRRNVSCVCVSSLPLGVSSLRRRMAWYPAPVRTRYVTLLARSGSAASYLDKVRSHISDITPVIELCGERAS